MCYIAKYGEDDDDDDDDDEMLNAVTETLIEMTPITTWASASELRYPTNIAVQKASEGSAVSVRSVSKKHTPTSNPSTTVVTPSPAISVHSASEKRSPTSNPSTVVIVASTATSVSSTSKTKKRVKPAANRVSVIIANPEISVRSASGTDDPSNSAVQAVTSNLRDNRNSATPRSNNRIAMRNLANFIARSRSEELDEGNASAVDAAGQNV